MSKEVSINTSTLLILGTIGFLGYTTINRFISFINNLRINLSVLKNENDVATVILDNLLDRNIPYKINSIQLLNDGQVLGKNTDAETGALITQNSNNPIDFNLKSPVSISDLENSDVLITYNYYGFLVKRLYKLANTTIEAEVVTESYSGCSC